MGEHMTWYHIFVDSVIGILESITSIVELSVH